MMRVTQFTLPFLLASLFVTIPFLAGATTDTSADLSCIPVATTMCGCGQVIDKQTGKCVSGTNKYQCPCSQTDAGKVTSGFCDATQICQATQSGGKAPQLPTQQQEQQSTVGSQPQQPSQGTSGSVAPNTAPTLSPAQPPETSSEVPLQGTAPTQTSPGSLLSNAYQDLQSILSGGSSPSTLSSPSGGESPTPDTSNSANPSWLSNAQVSLQPGDFSSPQENPSGAPSSAQEPVGGPTFESNPTLSQTVSSPMGDLGGLTNINSPPPSQAAQDLSAIQSTIANDAGKFGSWVDSALYPTGQGGPTYSGPTDPSGSPFLANERADLLSPLDPSSPNYDPELRDLVTSVVGREVGYDSPSADQALVESMVNRAVWEGDSSLYLTISDGFYAPVNNGVVGSDVTNGMSAAAYAATDQAVQAVSNGSNICNFCTDQGASYTIAGPQTNIGGENFGYMNGNSSWAGQQAQAQATYNSSYYADQSSAVFANAQPAAYAWAGNIASTESLGVSGPMNEASLSGTPLASATWSGQSVASVDWANSASVYGSPDVIGSPAVAPPEIANSVTPSENFAQTFDSNQPAIASQQWEAISMSEQIASVESTIGNESGGEGNLAPEPLQPSPTTPVAGSELPEATQPAPATVAANNNEPSLQPITQTGPQGGLSGGVFPLLNPTAVATQLFSPESPTEPGQTIANETAQSGEPTSASGELTQAGVWGEQQQALLDREALAVEQTAAYQQTIAQASVPVNSESPPVSQGSTPVAGEGGTESSPTVQPEQTPETLQPEGLTPAERIAQSFNDFLQAPQVSPSDVFGLNSAEPTSVNPFETPNGGLTSGTAPGELAFQGPTPGAPAFEGTQLSADQARLNDAFQSFTQSAGNLYESTQLPPWADTVLTGLQSTVSTFQQDYQTLANQFGQPSPSDTGEAIANETAPSGTQVAQNPDLTPLTPPSSSEQLGRNYYELGDTSPQVQSLQKDLNNLGYPVGSALTCSGSTCAGAPGQETDTFGPATYRAVEQFQADNSLAVDGKVGPDTIAAINAQINAQPITAAPTVADNSSPTGEAIANETAPTGEPTTVNGAQTEAGVWGDQQQQYLDRMAQAPDNVPVEQGLTFDQRVDPGFFAQPAVQLEDLVTAAEQPQAPAGTTPIPLDQLVSPQSFSITSEAAQNMALQGAATTLDSQFWGDLAQASENEQALSAQDAEKQAIENELEKQTTLEAQVLTGNMLPGAEVPWNDISTGLEQAQAASTPAGADQLQQEQAQADLQKQEDQALADMQPEKNGTPVNPNSPPPTVPQTPPPPTPQQLQAQALKNQINGLSSALRNFIANPTDQNLATLASRANAVAAQGGAFSNAQIQALAGQLGGISRAGSYSASMVVGTLSGYVGQINGGIGQAVGILNGIINKR